METWITGQVISKLHPNPDPAASKEANSFRGKIDLTHHQSAIFIIAPEVPYPIEPLRKLVGEARDAGYTIDTHAVPELDVPECDLKLETYVRLSALSEELQDRVRAALKLVPCREGWCLARVVLTVRRSGRNWKYSTVTDLVDQRENERWSICLEGSGSTGLCEARMLAPEAPKLESGMRIGLYEGAKKVGEVTIL